MKNSDLHTHSYYSDGEYSPTEVVKLAKKRKIKNLALTDHNSIDGVEEAIKEGNKVGVNVIPAVEIIGNGFEVLGYFINYKDSKMKKELLRCGYYQNEVVKRIINLLRGEGEDISFEKLKEQFPDADKNYNYAHLFYYLMSKGYEFQEALDKVMETKKKIKKPDKRDISVISAIKLIKKYKGVPVLSHPWIGKEDFTMENVKKYVKAGLKGIEYENGEKNFVGRDGDFKKKMKGFAKRYGLILTQGSDFHGPIMISALKRHELGKYNCDEKIVEKLKKLKEKR